MFPRQKEHKITGGGHDDRGDRLVLALWNDVHRMQSVNDCTGVVGVPGQPRNSSFLVLRKLWSQDRNEGRSADQRQDETDQAEPTWPDWARCISIARLVPSPKRSASPRATSTPCRADTLKALDPDGR